MIISLSDYDGCDNCEMLILPDGWTYGEQTNKMDFPHCMGELMVNEPAFASYHFVKFEAIADVLGVPALVVS